MLRAAIETSRCPSITMRMRILVADIASAPGFIAFKDHL